jgi:hypothetical protein
VQFDQMVRVARELTWSCKSTVDDHRVVLSDNGQARASESRSPGSGRRCATTASRATQARRLLLMQIAARIVQLRSVSVGSLPVRGDRTAVALHR